MSTKVTIKVSDKTLADLLCMAYEGGSNYWARLWEDGNLCPDFLIKHGTMVSDITNGGKYKLTYKSLQRGLQAMAKRYPKRFAEVLLYDTDYFSGDAWTGDCLLQCAIFGEMIYGYQERWMANRRKRCPNSVA